MKKLMYRLNRETDSTTHSECGITDGENKICVTDGKLILKGEIVLKKSDIKSRFGKRSMMPNVQEREHWTVGCETTIQV